MKITFLIIFILFTINIYSQDPRKDAKIPNYSNVVAYDMYESSDGTREYWDNYWMTRYLNADTINTYKAINDPNKYYSSTRRFNCHGYAWYMTSNEGSGLDDTPDGLGMTLVISYQKK